MACASAEMSTVSYVPHSHDVEIVGGVVRKVFVSWSAGEPDREWAAIVHLHDHARDLGPRPISRSVVGGRPAVIMSEVAGHPLSGPISRSQAEAFAKALKRLFTVPVPADLPVRMNDPASLQRRFRPWLSGAHEWGQCADPWLVRHAVDVASAWIDHHQPSDDWLVDPVIALGDGNLDNVLWDGEVCRLIDWEEYGASDIAYEVADVVEHASSRLGRRLDVEALLGDLRLTDAQRARVEHHRRRFACFWLAMLLPGNRGWHRNPSGSCEDQARHLLALVGPSSW